MYITLLFIYGWPFDSTVDSDTTSGTYTKVDKTPPLWIRYIQQESWQAVGQREWVEPYKIATIVVLCITAYIMIGDRIIRGVKKLIVSGKLYVCVCWVCIGYVCIYIYIYMF